MEVVLSWFSFLNFPPTDRPVQPGGRLKSGEGWVPCKPCIAVLITGASNASPPLRVAIPRQIARSMIFAMPTAQASVGMYLMQLTCHDCENPQSAAIRRVSKGIKGKHSRSDVTSTDTDVGRRDMVVVNAGSITIDRSEACVL